MATVNVFRYWIAVLVLVTVPPAIGLWFAIHPFARAWRKIGPIATYAVLLIPVIGMSLWLWTMRATLVGEDWGTQPALLAAGVILAVCGGLIARARRRHLTQRILVGVPELSHSDKGQLLIDGIYAKVRNPRYIEFLLFVLAYTCVANFSGTWMLFLVAAAGIHGVVLLEEPELRDRFGAEYEDYCRRVPRWIPRRRS